MEFEEFIQKLWEARGEIDKSQGHVTVQIQASSQFVMLPLDEDDGKTINIIRID